MNRKYKYKSDMGDWIENDQCQIYPDTFQDIRPEMMLTATIFLFDWYLFWITPRKTEENQQNVDDDDHWINVEQIYASYTSHKSTFA